MYIFSSLPFIMDCKEFYLFADFVVYKYLMLGPKLRAHKIDEATAKLL